MMQDNTGKTIPKISIIVPVYKVEKYLSRCIKSILRQTFTDFELILVDDGSPDKCPQMCDDWGKKDKRIRVIHKENGGLSSARNAGLRAARGEYIGFVDSDDWIACDMYEILYQLAKKYRADITCGGIERTNAGSVRKKTSGTIKEYTQDAFSRKYFKLDSNETVHYIVNKLYSHDTASKIKFPVSLINEDVEGFFLALLAAKKIVVIDSALYYYWENAESISYKWFTKKQMDLLLVWRRVCKICEKEKKEWLYFARLNYYRAYFGLLCRMLFSGESEKFPKEKEYLIRNLKKHYWILLKSGMPFNRKLCMTAMCLNYSRTEKIYKLLLHKGEKKCFNLGCQR